MCAGKAKRWVQKTPKQISLINGEPNLKRTIKMLNKLLVTNEQIFIIVNKNNQKFFEGFGNIIIGSDDREIDRFRNGFNQMELAEHIVFLYGDCVYNEEDLKKICSSSKDEWFGRINPNKLTGKTNKEIVGVSIIDKERFKKAVQEVAYKFSHGALIREIGWEVLSQLQDGLTEISDYTEDFDTGEEYLIMKKLYEN